MTGARGIPWRHSTQGGLVRDDVSSFRSWTNEPFNGNSLSADLIKTIFIDADDSVWLGTYGGLNRFDPATETFTIYRNKADRPDSLANDLNRLDEGTGTFTRSLKVPGDPWSLPNNTVRSLRRDSQGRLWVGTNNGLNHMEGDRFTRFGLDPADQAGLSNSAITRILPDSRGLLWVATRGGGLNRWDPATGGFTHLMRADGLPDNTVTALLEDRNTDLWIVTQTGLVRRDHGTEALKRITLHKELENASFNAGACVGPAGELYFGSVGVVTRFDPDRYEVNTHVPPVFVTDFIAANQAKLATPAASLDKPLRLAPWENSVEFHFAALDFRDSAQNQFAWRLEGFERAWTSSTGRRFASYTNLPGGRHFFRVKAANNDGVWNETGAAIAFSVARPQLLSTWAIILYLLIIAMIGYAMATLRSNRLLAGKVRELTETRTALEAAGAESRRLAREAEEATRAKSGFVAMVSHEIRNPLNGIIGMTELLARGGLGTRQREQLAVIRRSGDTLLALLSDILDLSKVEADRIELEDLAWDPRVLAERTRASFAAQATARGISLDLLVDDELPLALRGDPLRVGQVLANLISNTVRFTERGGVRIRVADTGIGIRPDKHVSIFEPFRQEERSTARRYGGTGLGLSIVQRLIGLMGGETGEVESAPPAGLRKRSVSGSSRHRVGTPTGQGSPCGPRGSQGP